MLRSFKNFPPFLRNYFKYCLIRKGPSMMELVLRNGLKFKIRLTKLPADAYDVSLIWGRNVYQVNKKDFSQDGSVIDIGAYIGSFSLLAAYFAPPGAKIYAFEPESANFQLLQDNIKLNNFESKIYPYNLAVSSDGGPKKLIQSSISLSRHSLINNSLFSGSRVEKTLPVISTTLEDFFKRASIKKCDVLRLNCEGAEFDILLNLSPDIFSRCRKIILEYHDVVAEYSHRDLIKYLENQGFEVEVKRFIFQPTGYLYASRINS